MVTKNRYLYGGRAVNASVQIPAGFTELGAETIAPLITCGILLDVAPKIRIILVVTTNKAKI